MQLWETNKSICFPLEARCRLFTLQLSFPSYFSFIRVAHCCCFFPSLSVQCSSCKCEQAINNFFLGCPSLLVSLLPDVCVCVCVCVRPSSSSPAHQPSHGSSEGRPGPPGVAVVGARQRRPVARALLHGAAQRASWEQLDRPLRLRQPRGLLLHSIQVMLSSFLGGFFCSRFVLFRGWY